MISVKKFEDLLKQRKFQRTGALRVKKEIKNLKLDRKFFVSEYKIFNNVGFKGLKMEIECSKPIFKAYVYTKGKKLAFEGILTEQGRIEDPLYEVYLRKEEKLQGILPSYSVSLADITSADNLKLISLVKSLNKNLRHNLSEVLSKLGQDLTLIWSIKGKPLIAYLGKEQIEEKTDRLNQMSYYFLKKKRMPKRINIRNLEKVVVKF